MLALEAHGKDRNYDSNTANIGNPKVNEGCPPLRTNYTSADSMENSPGPSIQYIPLGLYHTGGFNAWTRPMCYTMPVVMPHQPNYRLLK